MEERQAPPLRNPSRTAGKIAVALLIVIAIAGFVLAGLRSRSPVGEQPVADATQQGAVPPTGAATTAASAPEDTLPPDQIAFAPASDQLSDVAATKVLRLADEAKNGQPTVAMAARIEGRPDRAEQMDFARRRTLVVRQVLEQNGIAPGMMRVEITESPVGLVPPAQADGVEVALH
jgi:outer membrane protein OmpA-like peptidoglycan-associated protein